MATKEIFLLNEQLTIGIGWREDENRTVVVSVDIGLADAPVTLPVSELMASMKVPRGIAIFAWVVRYLLAFQS